MSEESAKIGELADTLEAQDESANIEDAAAPQDSVGENEGEPAEPQEQDSETNATFAELRRQHEQEVADLQAELEAYREQEEARIDEQVESNRNLYNAIDASDYAEYADRIDADVMADIIQVSEERGMEPIDLIEFYLSKTENQSLYEQNEELELRLAEVEADQEFTEFENEIAKIDPDFDVESMSDESLELLARGFSAKDIYAFEMRSQAMNTGTPASIIGKVNSMEGEGKRFFSLQDYDNMTPEQREKNHDKIMESQRRGWA